MARKRPSERTDAPSPSKARQILHDNAIRTQPLTDKQRGFFGAIVDQGRTPVKKGR